MRTSRIRFVSLVAVAALAAVTLAACSSSGKSASPSTNPSTNPTTTTTKATETSAPPPAAGGKTVVLASSKHGNILVDSNGMTLYVDEKDKPGAPNCTAACLSAWPPLKAPASPTYGPGLDASKFTVVTASDGTKQLAADGSPLYLWTNDKKPGDTTGQDVNGFYVVGANYKKVEGGGS